MDLQSGNRFRKDNILLCYGHCAASPTREGVMPQGAGRIARVDRFDQQASLGMTS